jgi:hypothetical protein
MTPFSNAKSLPESGMYEVQEESKEHHAQNSIMAKSGCSEHVCEVWFESCWAILSMEK